MNNVTDIFRTRLKDLRTAANLNQAELGTTLGISRGAISYYENGERLPDIEILHRIAKFFNVSSDYLLGLTQIPSKDSNTQAIYTKTGLIEKSIDILHNYHQNSQRNPQDAFDTVPAFSSLYMKTLNRLISYSEILENITRYIYLHFDSYYDDTCVSDEDMYHHISELGLFDKRLGIDYSGDYDFISQVFLLEIQKELMHLREDASSTLPDRITPIAKDHELENFASLENEADY